MSLGTSPTVPSLLIPPNPAFSSVDSAPRGGILINVHRSSEPFVNGLPSPAAELASPSKSYFSFHSRRPSDPGSPVTPAAVSPIVDSSSSHLPPSSPGFGSTSSNKASKIRFAPLPDPRRPRSLSTGRNIAWTAIVDENGEEKRRIEMKGHLLDGSAVDDDEEEGGEEDPDFDPEEGEEDESGHKRGRSWSKTMGSSWKGTKKLLTGKNPVKDKEKDKLDVADPNAYGSGAPLKKSVSTGGFIGSSPFRWTNETDRRRSMQGPPAATVSSLLTSRRESASSLAPSSPGHRRSSSMEGATGTSALGSSPAPVRMLNGRVYGSRRASEAAERERQIRERNEPAFVEWGTSESLGSNSGSSGRRGGGFMDDDDDGGGMSWVKRRREERQRREQEEREKQLQGSGAEPNGADGPEVGETAGIGLSSSQSSASSLDLGRGGTQRSTPDANINPKTPAISTSDLPPTPMIQVSSPTTPAVVTSEEAGPLSPIQPQGQSGISKARPISTKPAGNDSPLGGSEHVVQAMRIPSGSDKSRETKRVHRDVFDDDVSPTRKVAPTSDDEEEEEEEEEDDGDFEDDDEEEVDIRTTSSAAGVEVISRHKD